MPSKSLSKIIIKWLKLITNQFRILCDTIYTRTGVTNMWITNNSNKVLDDIKDYNENQNAKSIRIYHFSTLYTDIPKILKKNEMDNRESFL